VLSTAETGSGNSSGCGSSLTARSGGASGTAAAGTGSWTIRRRGRSTAFLLPLVFDAGREAVGRLFFWLSSRFDLVVTVAPV
jgi:hypothetical protein